MRAWSEIGMTLEQFTRAHQLPERWLSLRRKCEELVDDPQYWYRPDMQNAVRTLASDASDMLLAQLADCNERDVLCSDQLRKNVA